MGEKTTISWAESTWNPIRARNKKTGKVGWFCEHVSPGCENCYAESMNQWVGTGVQFKPGLIDDVEIFLDEEMLTQPLRWKTPRPIFPCSMTDLFGRFVKDEWLDRMFAVMALCPEHVFRVTTKRQDRMLDYISGLSRGERDVTRQVASLLNPERPELAMDDAFDITESWWPGPLQNVWLGVSVEDQQRADERIPVLLETPAAIRWISAEPLLEPIRLTGLLRPAPLGSIDAVPTEPGGVYLDWVVTGAESGHRRRPFNDDWARSLRDQCQTAGIYFFFKQNIQNGKKVETPELDGRTWTEYPRVA